MSGLQALIEQAYEQAKAGDWDRLQSEWKECPTLARRCSRYQKVGSGWTFLHQAAYFGNAAACTALICFGADAGAVTNSGKTAAQIAEEQGYPALAALLQRAVLERESLWAPPADPDLLPSSNIWHEAIEQWSVETKLVAYAGGVVKIPKDARYYVDALERPLIGWHGTFDPPSGMDGESLLEHRS